MTLCFSAAATVTSEPLGNFSRNKSLPQGLEIGQRDHISAIMTGKTRAQPLLHTRGSNHMPSTSRKAALICPSGHRANCFIDIHFWWAQYDESSSFFFSSKSTVSCCFFLALSALPPGLLGSPFPALPLPGSPQRAPGSSANCLLTFQGDISSPSHSASSVSSKPPLSLLTQGTPAQLLMLYSSSLRPPIRNFHHNKKLRNETINMYYFNRRLKNKKLLQQLPSQNHGDYCKAEKPKKRQL